MFVSYFIFILVHFTKRTNATTISKLKNEFAVSMTISNPESWCLACIGSFHGTYYAYILDSRLHSKINPIIYYYFLLFFFTDILWEKRCNQSKYS